MKAIEIIKKARQTHENWLAYLEKNPIPQEKYKLGGDIDHHRKWIKEYNEAIADIERLQAKNRQQAERIKELEILSRTTQL